MTTGSIIAIAAIIILLYIAIGASLPFLRKKTVSEETVKRVRETKFHGDEYTDERVHY
ncbi:MAG: hypothetical protein PHV73_04580 [Eubacteriales bacterium]|nr:hypothetical protein [Eubacteriales bacterium]